MDPLTSVSAVSIGRRLQDPLSELVKIEPSTWGWACTSTMWPRPSFKTALDEVVGKECVSARGEWTYNRARSTSKRVAGAQQRQGKGHLEYRDKNAGTLSIGIRTIEGEGHW